MEGAHLLGDQQEVEYVAHAEGPVARRQWRVKSALAGATAAALGLAGAVAIASGGAARSSVPTEPTGLLHHGAANIVELDAEKCGTVEEGDPCFFSVDWAMKTGIIEHPEWYKGLKTDSPVEEFQYQLWKTNAKNCTSSEPCNSEKLGKTIKARKEAAEKAAAEEAAKPTPPPGPRAQTFYMYRAQSKASYPLANINTADLAGVFWYLHQEIIVATPRKYMVDRIKRYKVTVKNTWEFWNAHKRQFSAFVAFDAGGCTTPVCKDMYHQYGFIVGCQVQPLSVAAYLSRTQTNWQCRAGEDACKSPIWYALPGPCPLKGIPNKEIDPDSTEIDVDKYKTPECIAHNPGGLCKEGDEPTGAPDCTYTYEEAGEVMLDDLVGIDNYTHWWMDSYPECEAKKKRGDLPEDYECLHMKEYDFRTDKGVGTDFWDGKLDKEKCAARLDKARALFKKNFPQFPEHLEEPPCEFDMYYGHEFDWKINHTNSPKVEWWDERMG